MSNNLKRYQGNLRRVTQEFLSVVEIADTVMQKDAAAEPDFYSVTDEKLCPLELASEKIGALKNSLNELLFVLNGNKFNWSKISGSIDNINLLWADSKYDLGMVKASSGGFRRVYYVDVKTKESTSWEWFNTRLVLVARAFFRFFDVVQSLVTKEKMNDTRETPYARNVRKFLHLAESAQFFHKPVFSLESAQMEFQIVCDNINKAYIDEVFSQTSKPF